MEKDEEKKTLPEEESKTPVVEAKDNVVAEAKKFSEKDFGKFKGKHIIMCVCAVVVLVLLVCILKGLFGSKDVEYPVIYNNADGDLYLMTTKVKKEDKAVKLSNGDSAYYVEYANTTNRYVLFEKNDDLYLYDAKKKDQTTKLVSDVGDFGFTEDDKFVIATDEEGNLYTYNFGKDKEKIDSDVEEILGVSTSKILYEKDGDLFVRSLKAKKDDRLKVASSDEYSRPSLSEDGKSVVYINDDDELQIYTISKKSAKKVAEDVYSYRCDTKSCTNMYYTDKDSIVYYYNGKDSKKIAEEVNPYAYDVDKQLIVYAEIDEDDYKQTLYFKKGTADAAKIEDDLDGIKSVRIFNGKEIYYVTSDGEVKYSKINGNKVSSPKSLAEDVGSLYEYKSGFVFVGDLSKDGSKGELYFAHGGKAKKVDSDVNVYMIKVSNDGSKVYYMKDYKTTGDLYVTSGGKGKKIDSDVYTYQYIKDKLIYYIKDYSSSKGKGDLYRYTGKSVKIAEDVTRIASTPNHFSKDKK